ncbi:hypothetical protein ACFVAV_18945 [Nocardia sp. NPDC057663]|uniref:DUF7691 family protein n=1 Tax=Nocardia sp. NPDC057663 TaxID=3346201 RepID=UPI0036733EA4
MTNAVGSKDMALFDAIVATWPDELLEDDLDIEDDDEDDEEEYVDLPSPVALRAVIDGGPFLAEHGPSYIGAYESLCEHLGDDLDHMTFHMGWVENVDQAFAALGMNLALSDLVYGGELDEDLDYPDCAGHGSWSKEACAEAVQRWDALDSAILAKVDSQALSSVEHHLEWLREATRRGKDIVAVWEG